tara:strand:- start:3091 stop:3915 length:825 start_codon:yes stop_codon:yes gene_type:complete
VLAKNIDIIKKNSKTFHFASAFLPKEIKINVLSVYAFCRFYDDSIDEKYNHDLTLVEKNIKNLKLNQLVINELKKGINSDDNFKRFQTINELIRYSYRVAGCVGLLMCELINVNKQEEKYYAIDLGIAMQLTNICRDIIEDYYNKRIYIPFEIYPYNKIDKNNTDIKDSINKLISISELYYDSALKGIQFIPIKSRFSILLALRLYQGIGKKIKNNYKLIYLNEANTNRFEKILIFGRCIIEFILFHLIPYKKEAHNCNLHEALKNLPFIHEKV